LKILVVDDNEDGRILLKRLLKKCGYEVSTATNGAEGLEKAVEQSPDFIISDVKMPIMDGFDLCRKCQQDSRLKDIPIVLYSATEIEKEVEELAFSLGAKAFIVKPAASNVLFQIIKGQFTPSDINHLIELLKNEGREIKSEE